MYDVFICHASEDKADIAEPLAQALKEAGVKVWYDNFCLKLGDSLRQRIEEGLASSKYGVVIFSEAFLVKKWPKEELDGLFIKEIYGQQTILPILHNLEFQQLVSTYPILAGRLAVRSDQGLDSVITKIMDVISPDFRHLATNGKCVAVSPNHVKLYCNGWKAKSQVIIKNTHSNPVHSVQIKFTLQPGDVDSACLQIVPDNCAPSTSEHLPGLIVTNNAFAIDVIDSNDSQAVLLFLHTMLGNQMRVIGASGTGPKESSAKIELVDFENQPRELFVKNGQVAMAFKLNETCRIKGQRSFFQKP